MAVSKAHLSHTFIGPRKLRAVAQLVRGKNAGEALHILKFTPKKGARILMKVIQSAIANADQKGARAGGKVDVDTLFIQGVDVGQGMIHYRVTPRARGSASWIRKRTSHVTVELGEK